MNNTPSHIDSQQNKTYLSVFVSSVAVIILGCASWLIFDLEPTQVMNLVFSVSVGSAIVTGFLLVSRRRIPSTLQLFGYLVAVSAIAVAMYLLSL